MSEDFPIILCGPIDSTQGLTRRERERQAVDSLLRQWFGADYAPLAHSPEGAPLLTNSELHISVSHSADKAVVALHHSPIGVDTEHWRDQLLRVAHKFLNKRELAAYGHSKAMLLRAWTAKEAVYKLAGVKGLSLADDIDLWFESNTARVVIDGQWREVTLHSNGNDQELTTYCLFRS